MGLCLLRLTCRVNEATKSDIVSAVRPVELNWLLFFARRLGVFVLWRQPSNPKHAIYCQQNNAEANSSLDCFASLLPHLGQWRVIDALADAQFLWIIQYEISFRECCKSSDSVRLQCTQQRKSDSYEVRKATCQGPEFLQFKENVATGAVLLNKVPCNNQW